MSLLWHRLFYGDVDFVFQLLTRRLRFRGWRLSGKSEWYSLWQARHKGVLHIACSPCKGCWVSKSTYPKTLTHDHLDQCQTLWHSGAQACQSLPQQIDKAAIIFLAYAKNQIDLTPSVLPDVHDHIRSYRNRKPIRAHEHIWIQRVACVDTKNCRKIRAFLSGIKQKHVLPWGLSEHNSSSSFQTEPNTASHQV